MIAIIALAIVGTTGSAGDYGQQFVQPINAYPQPIIQPIGAYPQPIQRFRFRPQPIIQPINDYCPQQFVQPIGAYPQPIIQPVLGPRRFSQFTITRTRSR